MVNLVVVQFLNPSWFELGQMVFVARADYGDKALNPQTASGLSEREVIVMTKIES